MHWINESEHFFGPVLNGHALPKRSHLSVTGPGAGPKLARKALAATAKRGRRTPCRVFCCLGARFPARHISICSARFATAMTVHQPGLCPRRASRHPGRHPELQGQDPAIFARPGARLPERHPPPAVVSGSGELRSQRRGSPRSSPHRHRWRRQPPCRRRGRSGQCNRAGWRGRRPRRWRRRLR